MCGIAGYLGPWPVSLLRAMQGALSHRGPDGEGQFHDGEVGIGLAHTRLAIIDLSDAAEQPMQSADGRYRITFNGEIYNFHELRLELEQDGVRFVSHSDTEVLLNLFVRHGAKCLDKLRGIFAFAVWDGVERRLFLARDHLGVKPLYYANTADGFLFASELKALTLCPGVSRTLDPVAVADHLSFVWTAGETTILKSVKKLRPGCMMTVDMALGVGRGVVVARGRYYHVPMAGTVPAASGNSDFSPAALTRLIDDVVREQMVADVDVGALLSGGVDSSTIVAAMCRATEPGRITTFCAGVQGGGARTDNFGDDLHFAQIVAQRFGVGLVEVPTDAELIDELPAMVWSLDEPTADFAAVQTLMLARAARDAGIKVLLSGVGGDDVFTGYGRHSAAMLYHLAGRVPGMHAVAGGLLRHLPPATLLGRRLQRIGTLLALDTDAMAAEAMSFSAVQAGRRMELLAPAFRQAVPADGVPPAFRRSLQRTEGCHPVERLLDLELNGFLPDHNLNYTDKMAMLAGVEVRVPLADPRIVDFAMAVPLSGKIGLSRTKTILRKSQAGRLPGAVLKRPKQGLGVPMRGWLKGPARELMEDLTAPGVVTSRGLFDAAAVGALKRDFHAGRVDAAMTLFPLMAIELWCRALDAAPTAELG